MDPQEPLGIAHLADEEIREAVVDAIYAHTEIGVSAASLDGCVLHHDATFAALLGRAGQDLRGLSYNEFLEPAHAAGLSESIRQLDQNAVEQLSSERRAIRPDGSTVWLATTGRLIKSAGGQHAYVVGLIRDITAERDAREGAAAELATRRQSEAELATVEAEHLRLLDRSPSAVLVHIDDTVVYANPAAVTLFGASRADQLIGQTMFTLSHPDEHEFIRRRLTQIRAGQLGESEKRAVRIRRLDGEEFLGQPSAAARLWQGKPATQVAFTDVTLASRAAADLAQQERFHTEVLDSMGPQAVVLDANGCVLSYNRAWVDNIERLGKPTHSLRGADFIAGCRQVDDNHSRSALALADGISAVLGGTIDDFRMDLEMSYVDGQRSWFSVHAVPLSGPTGGVVVILTDVTDRKDFEAELGRQATHDPLTGLPNRVLLQDRLEMALAPQGRRSTPVGLLFVDIDNFKLINDSFGHEVGDRILVIVADILRRVIRPGDTVARFGGDEFVIVVEELMAGDVLALASRVLGALRGSYPVGNASVALSASVGISVATEGDTASDVIRNADTAMFEAKSQGRDRAALFDVALSSRSRDRLEISQDLRYAVSRHELELHYQPVIDLRTGEVHSVEALLRWNRPGHGLVQPDAFIPAAEESGLIVPIGEWVLDSAMDWVAHPSRSALAVAINVAARQLSDGRLVETVSRALSRTGVDASRITLELTESTVMDDPVSASHALDQLKALGVRLSIDDFGTGYSSLGYLRRFPVDELKIDRSFVDGVASEESDAAIVTAIVSLAHTLGLIVVAEGIETQEQLDWMRGLNCERAQGFLIARPKNETDLDGWLAGYSPTAFGFAFNTARHS